MGRSSDVGQLSTRQSLSIVKYTELWLEVVQESWNWRTRTCASRRENHDSMCWWEFDTFSFDPFLEEKNTHSHSTFVHVQRGWRWWWGWLYDSLSEACVIVEETWCFRLTGTNVTDDDVVRVVTREHPNLQSLDLTFCSNITDASVLEVARRCSNLQSLNLKCALTTIATKAWARRLISHKIKIQNYNSATFMIYEKTI